MVKFSFVGLLIMLISSCVPPQIHNKKFLVKANEIKLSDRVRTDGYYYYEDDDEDGLGVNVIIFFEGGFLKDIGFISATASSYRGITFKNLSPEMSNANEFTAALRKTEFVLDNYSIIYNRSLNFFNKNSEIWDWGKYTVDGDSIKIQFFYNRLGDYWLAELNGIISLDNTIALSKGYDYKNKTNHPVDLKYRFQKYDNKDIAIPKTIRSIN